MKTRTEMFFYLPSMHWHKRFFQVFFSKVSWNNHTSRQKWKNSFGLECYSILFLNPTFCNYFSDSLDSISRYIPSFGLSSSVDPNAHSLPPSPSDDVVSPLTSSTSPLTSPRDLTCFPTPGEFAGEGVALLSKRVDVQRHSAHVSHALPQLMQSTCRKQFVCALECLSRLVRWKQKRQTTSICFRNELSFVPASAPSHKQMIGSRFYATGRKQSKQCCLWTWNTEYSNLRCQKACLIWAFWRPTPTAEFPCWLSKKQQKVGRLWTRTAFRAQPACVEPVAVGRQWGCHVIEIERHFIAVSVDTASQVHLRSRPRRALQFWLMSFSWPRPSAMACCLSKHPLMPFAQKSVQFSGMLR